MPCSDSTSMAVLTKPANAASSSKKFNNGGSAESIQKLFEIAWTNSAHSQYIVLASRSCACPSAVGKHHEATAPAMHIVPLQFHIFTYGFLFFEVHTYNHYRDVYQPFYE